MLLQSPLPWQQAFSEIAFGGGQFCLRGGRARGGFCRTLHEMR